MSRGSRSLSTWRIALVLLTLLAASAQQLVAQTHWHTVVAQADARSASPKPLAPGAPHDDCLLCQIAAHAGAAAPPAAIQLRVVASDAHVVRVPQVRYLVSIPQPAHAWQSRGPPTA